MIRPALAAIAGVALGYLIQVFYFVSFNIADWSQEGRSFALLVMFCLGCIAGSWTFLFVKERDNG
jgi:uncharacterized membrane protein